MKTQEDNSVSTIRKPKNHGGRLPFNKGNDHDSFQRKSKPAFKKGNQHQWSRNHQNLNWRDTRKDDFQQKFNKSFQKQTTNFQECGNDVTVANKVPSQATHTRFDIEDENETKTSISNESETNPEIKVDHSKSKTDRKTDLKSSRDKTKSINKKKPKKSKNKITEDCIPNFEDPKAKKKFFYRTLLVGGLPSMVEKTQLLTLFNKYGKISHVVLKNAKSDSLMSFTESFIVFQKRQDAIKALEVNGMKYEEQCLQVQICDGLKYDQSKAIVVTNLPTDTSEDDLWTAFKSCGAILNVHLPRNKIKEVTGTGYVNFESLSSVDLALQMENVSIKNQVVKIKKQKGLKKNRKEHKAVKKCSQEPDTQIPKSKFQKNVKSDKSKKIKLQEKKPVGIFTSYVI